ncbi:MAG: MmgE/PrpD family protein [Thermodesulfobacteriota bacterium]|nr:MmgE/PrpD family protein [Thermodesulfobacteriota bacterium]
MTAEEKIIDFAKSTQYEDLPQEAIDGVKSLMLNSIAAMLAGTDANGVKELSLLIERWGGAQESTVFLHGLKAPAHEASMVNAVMIRALDFDDFHMQTGMHTGAIVVPAAIAAAELKGNTQGKEIITAIALGAEILCRMRLVPDRCIGVSGWTGEIYGGFGGAITAGKILGLTNDEMLNALGLVYSQASGNAQTIYEGVLATRLQQGFSARSAIFSTSLAKVGLTGAKHFLEGKAGLYPVYYRGLDYNINRLTDGLGKRYEFLNLATKPYPCCGFLMSPIENILGIIKTNNISRENIKQILVRVNQQMYNTVCFPLENKYQPQTPADAMFSLPYVLSTAILTGDVILEDFSAEAIHDPRRLELAKRIEIEIDDDIDRESKELNLPLALHEINLTIKGEKYFSHKKYHAKGFPEKPMTMEDFSQKIKKCAPFTVRSFSEDNVESLMHIVKNLESHTEIQQLIDLLY